MYIEHPYFYEGKYYANIDGEMIEITKEVSCMGYVRKDVEKTKKIAKKFVCYQEGAELYSIGLTKFQELAKEAKAVYKMRLSLKKS